MAFEYTLTDLGKQLRDQYTPPARMSSGGAYNFDLNHLQGAGTTAVYGMGQDGRDTPSYDNYIPITGANGEPLMAQKSGNDWIVFPRMDLGGTGFSGQKLSKLNGVPYDVYGPDGTLKASKKFEGYKDDKIGDALGVGSILAMPFAAAGMGLGAAGAGTAVGGAAEGVGGLAGAAGGAGTSAAELAAGAGLGAGAPLGADAVAAYGGLAGTVTPEAMAAAMGMTPESFASLGAAGTGVAGAAAGQLAGTAAGGSGALGAGAGAAGAAGSLLPGGWSSLVTPALQLIGGAYTASQAGNATDAMVNATNNGINENRRQFDLVRGLLQPYVDAGTGALGAYQGLSGLKGADAQQNEINLLQNTPQFTNLAQQGENAILQNASATGGLRGGNTQGALANQRTNLLSALIDKQLGRYGSLIDTGQRSAVGTGNAAMTTGTNNASLMQQAGAAQAGGIVSGTNAITNAIGGIGGFFAGQGATAPQVPQVSQYGTGVAAPGQVRF